MSELPPNEPQPIIDHVPSAEELGNNPWRRQGVYERIDPIITSGYGEVEAPGSKREMLERFADKFHFAGPDSASKLMSDAYGIARQLGDEAIVERSQSAFALLESHRKQARYNAIFTASTEGTKHEEADGFVSRHKDIHGTTRNQFVVDVADARVGGNSFNRVESELLERGAVVPSRDLSTLLLLQESGHEAAHMIQNGLIDVATEITGTSVSKVDAMAGIAVAANPETGAAGDLKIDARRYNERFAEGYGMLVMTEAARTLGYDETTIRALVESVGLDAEKDVNNTGYAHFLDPTTIVRDLEVVSNVLSGETTISVDPESYKQSVAPSELGETVLKAPDGETSDNNTTRYRRVIRAALHHMGMRPPQ